jgi:hypothetical protein
MGHECRQDFPAIVRLIYLPLDSGFGGHITRIDFTVDHVQGVLLALVYG